MSCRCCLCISAVCALLFSPCEFRNAFHSARVFYTDAISVSYCGRLTVVPAAAEPSTNSPPPHSLTHSLAHSLLTLSLSRISSHYFLTHSHPHSDMSAVSLYTPYRAIGLVTDGTPFHVSQLGTESFVTLSLTHSFHVLKADRLTTCLVSEQVPATASPTHSPTPAITCLQPLGHETYVGVGSDILVYYRTRVVRTYASLSGGSAVQGMVSVGKVLFAYYLNNFVQVCICMYMCMCRVM